MHFADFRHLLQFSAQNLCVFSNAPLATFELCTSGNLLVASGFWTYFRKNGRSRSRKRSRYRSFSPLSALAF